MLEVSVELYESGTNVVQKKGRVGEALFVWKIKDSFSYKFIEIWAIICAGKDFFGVTW